MIAVLVLLAGIIFGAVNVGFFALGYYYASKTDEKGVTVTDENREFIEEMARWKNFDGR